jgi:hypothetical protein
VANKAMSDAQNHAVAQGAIKGTVHGFFGSHGGNFVSARRGGARAAIHQFCPVPPRRDGNPARSASVASSYGQSVMSMALALRRQRGAGARTAGAEMMPSLISVYLALSAAVKSRIMAVHSRHLVQKPLTLRCER